MALHSHGDSGRYLSSKYHRIRHLARTTTFSIDEWSDIEQERYDLDEIEFTRKHKHSSYITDARIDAEGASKAGRDWSDRPTGGE